MSRRNQATVREVLPDPKYNSTVVTKLINQVMYDGKRGIAQNIVYSAFDIVSEKTGMDAMEAFTKALENIKPALECKSRRVGGGTYQVPVEVRPARSQALAIRWLVTFARERKENGMCNKLAAEIIDAMNESGGAFKRKEEMHRMAEANKAFASYRW